ncbi:DUF3291 domain-containing protein [Rhodophyticola porphyridii]|uniref:DUF3291 domain-containing protein n=1 Tax=Rhodophyticola porphyridii TaxID=1852017 RepID=UPI001F255387|nr:DUF3291 domain-containing protein [Rhodophyticola porphyridii]
MSAPEGHHLAELNVGRLLAPVDDPRVAEFIDNVDRINGMGKRMPGFVWMMEGSGGPGNTDAAIGGDPRYIANLTVWESVETLEDFVWNTVHRRFYERRQDWFEVLGEMHFVMWWVPIGHRPTLSEALARLEHLRSHGAGSHAFDWAWLEEAELWKRHACSPAAAE